MGGSLRPVACFVAGALAQRRYSAGGFYYDPRLIPPAFWNGESTVLGPSAFEASELPFTLYYTELGRIMGPDEAFEQAVGCYGSVPGPIS
jgi:hypothetical protein